MNDQQVMHAISIDDAYRVEHVLAQGAGGVTELVTIGGAGPFVRKKIPSELARRRVWSALTECASDRLPHVEATYELPDQFVVVYDFVPGENLESHVDAHGRLDFEEAVRLIEHVCEAAEDLHRHDIIHRDISPANVIVSSDGAHLLDLGIARMRIEGATKDTTSLGTWGFASPEQYGFAQTDARSDVYSIGRLLGYLLTGVRPGADGYDAALADANVVSPQVRRIIERACAFEPSARYQSTEELANELRALTQGTDASADKNEDERTEEAAAPAKPQAEVAAAKQSKPHAARKHLVIGIIAAATLALALGIGGYFALTHLGSSDAQDDQTADNQPPATSKKRPQQSDQPDKPSTQTNPTTSANIKGVLELVETGWSVDSSGYVHYGFGLKNTSEDVRIQLPAIDIVGRADDGSVLFSQTQVLFDSFAGQTTYYGGQTGNGEAPASVDFKLVEPEDYNVQRNGSGMAFTVSNTSVRTDNIGNIVFTGEVTTETDEVSGLYSGDLAVSVILRDANGTIVYGDTTFIKRPGKSEAQTFEITVFDAPSYDSYEVYAQVW